jgi:hypothetical protein
VRLARTLAEPPSPRRLEARADAPGGLRGGVGEEAAAAFGETLREAVARIDRDDALLEPALRAEPDAPIAGGLGVVLTGAERPTTTAEPASLDGWLAFLSGAGRAGRPAEDPEPAGEALADEVPADERPEEPRRLEDLEADGERLGEVREEPDERGTISGHGTEGPPVPTLSLIGNHSATRLPVAPKETADDAGTTEAPSAPRRSAAERPVAAETGGQAGGQSTALGALAGRDEAEPEPAPPRGRGTPSAEGGAAHEASAASAASDDAAGTSGDAEPARDPRSEAAPEAARGARGEAREPMAARGGESREPMAARGGESREPMAARGGESRAMDAADHRVARARRGAAVEVVTAGGGVRAPIGRDLGTNRSGSEQGPAAILERAAPERGGRTEIEAERKGRAPEAALGSGRTESSLGGEHDLPTAAARPPSATGRTEPAEETRRVTRAERRDGERGAGRPGEGDAPSNVRGPELPVGIPSEASVPSAARSTEPSAPAPTPALPEAVPARQPAAEPGASSSPSERWSAREGYLPPSMPDTRTSIELDHPTLGPLSLRFAGEAGRVAVELGASSVAAAVALRTSEAELRRELAGTGTELSRFRVRTRSRGTDEDAPTPGTWQPPAGHARRRI